MRLRFLDGLRGWGAVVVLLYHTFWGSLPPAAGFKMLNSYLPFNGPLAVMIFFIASGFSLTVRYLDKGDLQGWLRILRGRYVRLVIPILSACLVMHLAMVLGAVSTAADRLPDFQFALNFDPTVEHLLRFALWDVFFAYTPEHTYIGPLWTMGPELIGSFFVLALVLVLGRATWRLPALILIALGIVLFAPNYRIQSLSLFPVGAAIADCFNRGWIEKCPVIAAAALIGTGVAQPFIATEMSAVILLGAIPFTLGCICLRPVREWLSNPLSAHLGEISFPLYLIHGPVIVLIGEPLTRHTESLSWRIGIDLLVVILSFVAAYAFVPVNKQAIAASHRFDGLFAAGRANVQKLQREERPTTASEVA
jgi:peptidoglycan/LPS O-acetylase OafA/YrhL